MTRMLSDVAAEEAPEEVRSKTNSSFGPIEVAKVNKATGRMLYCGKTSYCYNSNAFEFVTPCRLKVDKEKNSAKYFIYFAR